MSNPIPTPPQDRSAISDELISEGNSHLADVAALLERSVGAGRDESTPPLPEHLQDRIRERYGEAPGHTKKPEPHRAPAGRRPFLSGWLRKLARPQSALAGGLVAAAACVTLVLTVGDRGGSPETFRSSNKTTTTGAATVVVLRGVDPASLTGLDSQSLRPVTDRAEQEAVMGAEASATRVLVSRPDGKIYGFKAGDTTPSVTLELEEDEDLVDAVLDVTFQLR